MRFPFHYRFTIVSPSFHRHHQPISTFFLCGRLSFPSFSKVECSRARRVASALSAGEREETFIIRMLAVLTLCSPRSPSFLLTLRAPCGRRLVADVARYLYICSLQRAAIGYFWSGLQRRRATICRLGCSASQRGGYSYSFNPVFERSQLHGRELPAGRATKVESEA